MQINNVEIYKLDKWNFSYRVLRENTKNGKVQWFESKKYYNNIRQCVLAVKEFIVNEAVEDCDSIEEAINKLNILIDTIDKIIKIV